MLRRGVHFWQRPMSWENNHPSVRGCRLASQMHLRHPWHLHPQHRYNLPNQRGVHTPTHTLTSSMTLFSSPRILHHLTAAIRALKRQRRSALMWARQWHLSAQQGSLNITIKMSGLVSCCYKIFLQGTADKVLHWTPGMWQHRTEWYSHHKIEHVVTALCYCTREKISTETGSVLERLTEWKKTYGKRKYCIAIEKAITDTIQDDPQ